MFSLVATQAVSLVVAILTSYDLRAGGREPHRCRARQSPLSLIVVGSLRGETRS